MKRITFLLVASVLTLAIAPASAQHEHHRAMQHKSASRWKVDIRDDNVGTLIVRLGPLNLPAHSDHMAVAQAPHLQLALPFDGWITSYHPRLVDDQDTVLPGRLLHHVAFWNASRSDFLCPNKEEHIFGAGGEMNEWPALPGFGYRVARGDRIRISTMFHNPTATSYPRTYIEVRMEYQKAGAGVELKSVYPAWFDVQQCGSSGYDLVPGKNVASGEFTLNFTGTLLGVGGHMHDYGQRLVLANATRREQVATLDAKLDPQGLIQSMPIVTFLDRGGYKLSRGDTIQVRATYQNPTGRHLPEGAMGIVVGYFLPDDDLQMAALRRALKAARARKGP